MRVLICGSRDWPYCDQIDALIQTFSADTVIIHGAGRGADLCAAYHARERGLVVLSFPADWDKDGKAAGPLRNQRMLDEGKPNIVIAFRRAGLSPGTDDMIARAQKAMLPVLVITSGSGR